MITRSQRYRTTVARNRFAMSGRSRRRAGRPDLRVHDLRHTGATMAARAGATLAELQERLGHSSVDAALRYQHAARGRDQEIAAALSAMVRGRST